MSYRITYIKNILDYQKQKCFDNLLKMNLTHMSER